MPVSGHLIGHRRETNQVRSPRHHPFAREDALEHLNVAAFTNSELHGPPYKRLAGRLNEDDGPASVIYQSRFGYRRSNPEAW